MSDFSDGQIRQWREFHPRAVKLLQHHKPFLVVANDEPYYAKVYAMIREHEIKIGRWSEIDERKYQAAQPTLAPDRGAGLRKMDDGSMGAFDWSDITQDPPAGKA